MAANRPPAVTGFVHRSADLAAVQRIMGKGNGAQERTGSPPPQKPKFARIFGRPVGTCVPASCTVFKPAHAIGPQASHFDMKLPETLRQYGMAVLARNPEIVHAWSAEPDYCNLSIPASHADGFDIRVSAETDAITLSWGNWHTRFEPTAGNDTLVEVVFGLVRDMLSSDMRIRELRAGDTPYRGFLEAYDGTRWSTEQTMGLIFWNYLARRSVRTYSNSILPRRMSTASIGDPS